MSVEQRIIPGFQAEVGVAASRDSVPASELHDPAQYRQIGVDDVARVMVGLGIAEADTVRDYIINLSRGRVAYAADWRDIDLGATHILCESVLNPGIRERFQSIYGEKLNSKTLWSHGFGGDDVDMVKSNYQRTGDEQALDAKAEADAWERLAESPRYRDDYLTEPELEEIGVFENAGNTLGTEEKQDLARREELLNKFRDFGRGLYKFDREATRLAVGMSIAADIAEISRKLP